MPREWAMSSGTPLRARAHPSATSVRYRTGSSATSSTRCPAWPRWPASAEPCASTRSTSIPTACARTGSHSPPWSTPSCEATATSAVTSSRRAGRGRLSAVNRPRPARLDDVTADVAVASHDGVDHGGEWDPVRAQAVGIDVDLVLAHGSADAGHLGHAGHRVELVADEPVLQRTEVAERRALALNGVPEDMAHSCGIG